MELNYTELLFLPVIHLFLDNWSFNRNRTRNLILREKKTHTFFVSIQNETNAQDEKTFVRVYAPRFVGKAFKKKSR